MSSTISRSAEFPLSLSLFQNSVSFGKAPIENQFIRIDFFKLTDNIEMGQFFQVFFLVIIGVLLLWFGYTLFFGLGSGAENDDFGTFSGKKKKNQLKTSYPGAPQTCPVCSVKLEEGLMVKSIAFPSLNGGKDRFMHIKGCIFCLAGEQERVCPVCNHILIGEEVLICRLFERHHHILQRSHVHVLGCTFCRG